MLRQKVESGEMFLGADDWFMMTRLPAPVGRLVQCLAEEAEASPGTLAIALLAIAVFARGCSIEAGWRALSCGPYGEELLHLTWSLYRTMKLPQVCMMMHTLQQLFLHRNPGAYWLTDVGLAELSKLLESEIAENVVQGLLVFQFLEKFGPFRDKEVSSMLEKVESHLFAVERAVSEAAAFTWGSWRRQHSSSVPSASVLDRLLSLWAYPDHKNSVGAYALGRLRLSRQVWRPVLSLEQTKNIRGLISDLSLDDGLEIPSEAQIRRFIESGNDILAAFVVAFHSGEVITDDELAGQVRAFTRKQLSRVVDVEFEGNLEAIVG